MSRHRWRSNPDNDQASHADDWLITYADMITLLLCFFAIFLSVSLPKKMEQKKIEAPQRTAEVLLPETPPKPVAAESKPVPVARVVEKLPEAPARDPAFHGLPPQEPLDDTPEPVTAPPPVELVQHKIEMPQPVAEVIPQKPAQKPAEDTSIALNEVLERLRTQGNAKIEQKGDRITTMQMSSAAFFDIGSATLSESGKVILQTVAVNLQSEQFREYQITVEGHTDDSPISTAQFPSNWELSTSRASAVVQFFLQHGIPARKLRAAGYADTFPIAPNRDASNNPIPENQARNRRVVIKLEKIDKAE